MGRWERLKSLTKRARYAKLIDRVAARSQNAVWHRVQSRIHWMTENQARGYVRSRAAMVIHRELDIATSSRASMTREVRKRAFAAASGRVVERTVQEMIRQRTQSQRRMAA